MSSFTRVAKRDFLSNEHDKAASAEAAMSDGVFRIYSSADATHSISLACMSPHPICDVRAHTKGCAEAIGAEGANPEDREKETRMDLFSLGVGVASSLRHAASGWIAPRIGQWIEANIASLDSTAAHQKVVTAAVAAAPVAAVAAAAQVVVSGIQQPPRAAARRYELRVREMETGEDVELLEIGA